MAAILSLLPFVTKNTSQERTPILPRTTQKTITDEVPSDFVFSGINYPLVLSNKFYISARWVGATRDALFRFRLPVESELYKKYPGLFTPCDGDEAEIIVFPMKAFHAFINPRQNYRMTISLASRGPSIRVYDIDT